LQVETFDANGTFAERYTYHADHLGSIRFLTDAAGNIANVYDYDSYGNILTQVETVEQPFLYTGREYDAAFELFHYRARYYDPNMGVACPLTRAYTSPVSHPPVSQPLVSCLIYTYARPINKFISPTGHVKMRQV